jgi:putative ABC transport system substrate-binding protein
MLSYFHLGAFDPVGGGLVDSLARPGGNATGFLVFEYSLSGKWLDLLKQIAPSVTRVAVLRDVIQSQAQSLGLEVSPVSMRNARQIELDLATFARSENGGLIVTTGAPVSVDRDLIIALAAKHKLPTVYPYRYLAAGGGLMS